MRRLLAYSYRVSTWQTRGANYDGSSIDGNGLAAMNGHLDVELRSGHPDTEMDRQVEKAQVALLARYAPVAEPIAEQNPNIRVIRVPDAGHLP